MLILFGFLAGHSAHNAGVEGSSPSLSIEINKLDALFQLGDPSLRRFFHRGTVNPGFDALVFRAEISDIALPVPLRAWRSKRGDIQSDIRN